MSNATDDYRRFVEGALGRSDKGGFMHPTAMQVVFSLITTASQISYDLEATVHRPRGLSWAGYRLLVVLSAIGPLDPTRAAPLAGMSRAALSAVANTLERDGLLNRQRSPDDGRSVVMTLTAKGRRVMAGAKAANNEREEAWCSDLTETERRELVALLAKLAGRSSSDEFRQRA